jgi:hypothetical protein
MAGPLRLDRSPDRDFSHPLPGVECDRLCCGRRLLRGQARHSSTFKFAQHHPQDDTPAHPPSSRTTLSGSLDTVRLPHERTQPFADAGAKPISISGAKPDPLAGAVAGAKPVPVARAQPVPDAEPGTRAQPIPVARAKPDRDAGFQPSAFPSAKPVPVADAGARLVTVTYADLSLPSSTPTIQYVPMWRLTVRLTRGSTARLGSALLAPRAEQPDPYAQSGQPQEEVEEALREALSVPACAHSSRSAS